MKNLTPEQQIAVRCCLIILSIDSDRGNEKLAAKLIAGEFNINWYKLKEGKYDV